MYILGFHRVLDISLFKSIELYRIYSKRTLLLEPTYTYTIRPIRDRSTLEKMNLRF